MKVWHYLSASILAFAAQPLFSQVINIPQSALLPPGDPGMVPWVASDAGLGGPTTVKLIAEITGTAVANSFVLDIQNNGFPAPPIGGATDDVVVFDPGATPGAMASVDIPPACGLALFHDVFDETGVFLSGPNGILDGSGPDARDAYLNSDSSKSYTIEGRRQLVKHYIVYPAHSYQFTSQWGTVTQLGSGFRVFIFLDDDHTPNYDYDDMIIGIVAPPCVDDLECNDGDLCNGVETCVEGVCQAGQPVVCSDGVLCNGVEFCLNGECESGSPPTCDDGISCTDDSCNVNQCVHTPNKAHCPDGLFCNGTESCDVVLDCVSPGNPCVEDEVCDEEADLCRACLNNEECDDTNPCTVGNSCTEGSCQLGEPMDCSASSTACFIASCDPNGKPGNCDTAILAGNGTPCSDDLFCTVNDTCQTGFCTGGPPRNCGAAEGPCLVRDCIELLNACVTRPVQDGLECDDEAFCTVGDTCHGGECHGTRPQGLEQWSELAACLEGPDIAFPLDCDCQDLESDGRIDLLDAGMFQILMVEP